MSRQSELEERRSRLRQSWTDIEAAKPGATKGAKLSGPWIEVFFEGWARIGFRLPRGSHYWRRRPGDMLLSLCGLRKPIEYTIRGQSMIFEIGNFEKCAKCARKRQR